MTAVYENYKHPLFKFQTEYLMELDVYLPSLNLALEYQGEQHYSAIYALGDQKTSVDRDQQKLEACKAVCVKFSVLKSEIGWHNIGCNSLLVEFNQTESWSNYSQQQT